MTSHLPPAQSSGADRPADLPADLKSRAAAVEILYRILYKNRFLDFALEESQTYTQLPERDKRLVRMIVSTCLRRLGQIDDIIDKATNQSQPPRPPKLHILLRASVTQILFMETADYAAVDTAVSLAAALGLKKQKGFVNAVLRRVAKDGPDWVRQHDPAVLNIPDWLLAIWRTDFGDKTARDIALACLGEAPLDICPKNPEDATLWAEKLKATVMPTGILRLNNGGFIPDLPGYNEGAWWIQDMAATLPVKILGAALPLQDRTVFDLCAAPGGKTAQLAAAGARVTAVDRSARRMTRLEDNINRLHLNANVTPVIADSGVWDPSEQADAVLLDAPCSATGTVRRHPDTLHLKSPQDIERLTSVQLKLLNHAIKLLKPGGVLVYCTCSLQKAEGETLISAFLDKNKNMARQPVKAEDIGNLEQVITEEGDVRCLPFHLAAKGGMDGFYATRLVKRT